MAQQMPKRFGSGSGFFEAPVHYESMKIDEIATTWDRAKVSLGAEFCPQVSKAQTPTSTESHEIAWKHMEPTKIHEITASWVRAKVSLRHDSVRRSPNLRPLKSWKCKESNEIL